MSNWLTDYHHALMLRLAAIVLALSAWMLLALLGRPAWRAASNLLQRTAHGKPLWHHSP